MFVSLLERSIDIVVSFTVHGHDSITFTIIVDFHVTGQFRLLELGYSTNKENL